MEDEEAINNILTTLFRCEGYRVVPAARGEEAIKIAQELQPDLITLDLALPDINGRDVAIRLLEDERTREIPIIVISAHASWMAPSRQVRAVIAKPFDVDRLLDTVNAFLDGQAAQGPRP